MLIGTKCIKMKFMTSVTQNGRWQSCNEAEFLCMSSVKLVAI